MKFRKQQRKPRRPYYSDKTREAMREEFYRQAAAALASGKTPDELTDTVAAYNVTVNPVKR